MMKKLMICYRDIEEFLTLTKGQLGPCYVLYSHRGDIALKKKHF